MIGNNGINGAIKQGIEKVRDFGDAVAADAAADRKSTRLNSSHQ